MSLDGDVRYNPLHNDLDAYALAFGIASLLNNLFGKGREPFWQQAYTNLVKFVILLHKVLYDYVTLFDVYQGAINPDYLEKADQRRRPARHSRDRSRSPSTTSWRCGRSKNFPFEPAARATIGPDERAPLTAELRRLLERASHALSNRPRSAGNDCPGPKRNTNSSRPSGAGSTRTGCASTNRLRTSIVEGISVFLSLFDDNPAVKRVFCPPKETYDPVANADGRFGRPLPPFADLVEQGAVCALNFPVSANPGLARTIGTLMKQDFQRAVLEPHSEDGTERRAGPVTGARRSFSATSTTPSPPLVRTTRPATRSSSRSPARPSASRSSRRRA